MTWAYVSIKDNCIYLDSHLERLRHIRDAQGGVIVRAEDLLALIYGDTGASSLEDLSKLAGVRNAGDMSFNFVKTPPLCGKEHAGGVMSLLEKPATVSLATHGKAEALTAWNHVLFPSGTKANTEHFVAGKSSYYYHHMSVPHIIDPSSGPVNLGTQTPPVGHLSRAKADFGDTGIGDLTLRATLMSDGVPPAFSRLEVHPSGKSMKNTFVTNANQLTYEDYIKWLYRGHNDLFESAHENYFKAKSSKARMAVSGLIIDKIAKNIETPRPEAPRLAKYAIEKPLVEELARLVASKFK